MVDREQGVVCGVVTCKGLIGFLRHHDEHANAHRMRRVSMLSTSFGGNTLGGGSGAIDADADEEDAVQHTGRAEAEGSGKAGAAAGRFSPSQLIAQARWQISSPAPAQSRHLSCRRETGAACAATASFLPSSGARVRGGGGRTSAGRGAPSSSSPWLSSSTSPSASTTSSPP